jgi:succinate dehydrogenase/fumarate reductase flavoprotein subunit
MRIAERRECDVLVCGGGTAGRGAAIAAARNGATTILVGTTRVLRRHLRQLTCAYL